MIVRKLAVLGFLLGGLFVLSMIPQQASALTKCQQQCISTEDSCLSLCGGNVACQHECEANGARCLAECD